jgi:hypothetical protein
VARSLLRFDPPTSDHHLERARKLARVLDHDLVDPLIGLLLPGVGDVLGALVGLYIVGIAARRSMSPVIIVRMLLNLTVDLVIGMIPLLGDLFDFFFKANERNVELLAARSATGGRAMPRDWALVILAALGFLSLLGLVLWGIVALVRAIV